MREHRQIFFGPFRLNLTDQQLFRVDQEIYLRPKSFAVLQYMAEHPGQLIIKDELIGAVWPDGASDDVLTGCIREIRSELGDDQANPEFIETRPRRGYVFIAKVTSEQREPAAARLHFADVLEGKIVVGYQYGEELNTEIINSLYSLASGNARSLMELADIERFAVDDCIILTNSRNFQGWEPHEVKTTVLNTRLPIPDDLEKQMREKLAAIENHYFNSSHYRLLSYTPSLSDIEQLEVNLAPVGFHEYYSLTPFFDAPLLDGAVSIRQKYGHTALTYSAADRGGTCLIPAPISIQCVVLTADQQIILMRRSSNVAFYPNHWSASFEETMNASGLDRQGNPTRAHDVNFFAGALRGLEEEFGVTDTAVESLKVISLNVEYLTLSVDPIVVIKLSMTGEEVRKCWLVEAWDRDEADKFGLLPAHLPVVVEKLFSQTLWHPTARMRLIQFLFHTYGVKAVAAALRDRSK